MGRTQTQGSRRWPKPRWLAGLLRRPGSTTNPNKGGFLQSKPPPLPPAPGVDRPEGRRRPGGGGGGAAGAGAQFHLAPRLSPWEKPASSATHPLTPALSAPRGPRSGCPWGQGWASLRLFPARAGVATPQGTCWVVPRPSPATPHTESPFRQERSAELRLLMVCRSPTPGTEHDSAYPPEGLNLKGRGKQVAERRCCGHHPWFLGTPTQ